MEQRAAHILLVDDEAAIRVTTAALLQRRGYTVVAAASGEEALEILSRQVFDLLLLDFRLPGINGLELAKHARALLPAAIIMILTGQSNLDGAPENLRTSGFEYMLKTASPREVLERIAALLR
jgi:DNA-binding response OmpR family regulator